VIAPPLPSTAALEPAFLAAFRTGTLTESQADRFLNRDPIELKFLLLQLSAAIADTPAGVGPHTPSGAIPPHAKPAGKRRKKKSGARPGHEGHCRPTPERVDRTVVHALPPCPGCHGELADGKAPRRRVVEDIPENLKVEAVEHVIPRGYCKNCHKQYEPKVVDALPNATLGNRVVVLTAWLHYGLGTTTSQVVDVLNGHLQVPVSAGGLHDIWHRLAEVLTPWYDQIADLCRTAPVLHMDETGWRTAGRNGWLWCGTARDATYYWIHPSRGHDALDAFFAEEFTGVLVSDFWSAYDAVAEHRQKCWPHLLRELKEIDGKDGDDDEWKGFSKKLKRIYADGIRLKLARDELGEGAFAHRVETLQRRLIDLGLAEYACVPARRLAKRLVRYWDALLTFVEHRGVPADNNRAEREIRPAVLMRKASYGSGSDRGAATRGVLMSIYRTLKQRGVDALAATESALRTYIATGQLPLLPTNATSKD
jgi:transposase